ncbi:MAG: 30S ribosomal protein S12 methylthiotransferase RimO [Desulfitobacteriaceae bacterium]|nr:30S ribosomal protein S12 methylthiotransferase RimO [Desulfitobacteriaceae bacterium]
MTYNIALASLGCSKNLVDSEIMLGLLKENNYQITEDFIKADVIIVNTCGFILSAKEESIETILSMAQYKKTGNCKVLVATGCLVEKYREELAQELPEIDGWLGTGDFQNIVSLLDLKLKGKTSFSMPLPEEFHRFRMRTTPEHLAYVKIAEGCDNRCTYCLIPQMRGRYHSKPMESIRQEVRELLSQGVKEINLIAQDSTYYGMDIYGEEKLPELLASLAEEDVPWIRLFYSYPARISKKLLDVLAAYPNICKYLDIPIQHADDFILRRMGRHETGEDLVRLIDTIQETIPQAAIRTTCMVGFPGETEERFENLLDFVSKVKFDWLGAFTFSREEDTPAALLSEQVPEEIKQDRYDRLMSLQTEISLENKKKWLGRTINVLVEGKSSGNPEYFIGRSQFQAPDVDGVVFIKARNLKVGQFVPVTISDSDIYDLVGEIKAQ